MSNERGNTGKEQNWITLDSIGSVDEFLRRIMPFALKDLSRLHINQDFRPSYLYRGDRKDLPLVAGSADQREDGKWLKGLHKSEVEMMDWLREEFGCEMSDWDIVAMARHHGLHLRFLDWSGNPLVALYFALGKEDKGKDHVVWVLETRKSDFDIPEDETTPFPACKGSRTKIYKPSPIDARIVAQDGYMMRQVYVKDRKGTLAIEPVEKNSTFKGRLWQIPVNKETKDAIRKELESLRYDGEHLRLPSSDDNNRADDNNRVDNNDNKKRNDFWGKAWDKWKQILSKNGVRGRAK